VSYIIPIVLLLLISVLPRWWVKKVFRENSEIRTDLPGTGGELAEHLIQELNYADISVVATKEGDHFNPETGLIALNDLHFEGKSLTAIAVAAHEIGHLIQHRNHEIMLEKRTELIKKTLPFRRFSGFALMLFPVAVLVFKSPLILLLFVAMGFSSTLLEAAIHLITLPVELDASFRKALPILQKGDYINKEDEPRIRKILLAAALTYVASALAGLVDLSRWMRLIRRR